MYNSQYYTCEQIDQRLLQGYVDDFNSYTDQSLTKAQFLAKLAEVFSPTFLSDYFTKTEINNIFDVILTNGFIYGGVATPNGTPNLGGDGSDNYQSQLFFIATQPGTYTNYGGVVIPNYGFYIILWDTDTWSFDTVFTYANIGYFECDTAAGTAAKTVAASGYVLMVGGSIKIKMINANNANNATLNINSTGAKPLFYGGERASSANSWDEGEVIEVYYDGTNYQANNAAGGSGSGEGAFDISVYNKVDGQPASYSNLSAALAAMSSVRASKKKGGMSIKFIQSSDNKYVQYMLLASDWSVDINEWEKINLEHEVDELDIQINDNPTLIDLSGLTVYNALINSANKWDYGGSSSCVLMPVIPGQEYFIDTTNLPADCQFAFLKQSTPGAKNIIPQWATGVSGRTTLTTPETAVITAPEDAVTLYLRKTATDGHNMLPNVYLGRSATKGLAARVDDLEQKTSEISDDLSELDQEVDKNFEALATTPFDLSSYLVAGYHINTNADEWLNTNTSNCYLVPVTAGQVFYVKSPEININIYWAFLTDNVTSGVPSYVSGTGQYKSSDNVNFVKVVIPEGCNYFYIDKNTLSTTDHTPIIKSGLVAKVDDLEHEVDKLGIQINGSTLIDLSGLTVYNAIINSSGEWVAGGSSSCVLMPVIPGQEYFIDTTNLPADCQFAFLKQSTPGASQTIPQWATGVSGRTTLTTPETAVITAPEDAVTLYLRKTADDGHNMLPNVYLGDGTKGLAARVDDLEQKTSEISDDLSELDQEVDELDVQINGLTPIDLSGLTVYNALINSANKWDYGGSSSCVLMPVIPGQEYFIDTTNLPADCQFAFLKQSTPGAKNIIPQWATGVSGRTTLTTPETAVITAPEDAVTLYLRKTATDGHNMLPNVYLGDGTKGLAARVDDLEQEVDELDQEVDKNFEALATPFDLSSYLVAGYHINTEADEWLNTNTSNCYLVPVTAGQVFYVKSPEININIYWAFLTDNVTSGVPSYVSGTGQYKSAETSRFICIVVPEGTNYLYFNKNTLSTTDHTPIINAVSGSLDSDALVVGTFNSSYNEEDTEAVRDRYCGIIKGKDNIETFMFFSDPHLTDYDRYQTMTEFIRDSYISKLQKYYNSLPMDYCICGGDWLNFNHTDDEACGFLGYCDAYMRKLFKNYLPVFGNHDNNPYQDGNVMTDWLKALTYIDIRNLMFREERNTWYSADGINTKFYILNSGVSFIKGMTDATYSRLVDNRWTQVDWYANKLLTDDAPHSIVVMHLFSNGSNPTDWYSTATGYRAAGIHEFGKNIKLVAEAYNRRESITLNGITYDFSGKTGKVAFILCGHTHWDFIDPKGDVPVVCITNLAGGYLSGGSVIMAKTPTFDNCICDYDNDSLYMVRVGIGVSRIVNYVKEDVSIGGSATLTSQLSETIAWSSRDTSIATVADGVVTGIASGYTCIIATAEDGTEEYWIIKVTQ